MQDLGGSSVHVQKQRLVVRMACAGADYVLDVVLQHRVESHRFAPDARRKSLHVHLRKAAVPGTTRRPPWTHLSAHPSSTQGLVKRVLHPAELDAPPPPPPPPAGPSAATAMVRGGPAPELVRVARDQLLYPGRVNSDVLSGLQSARRKHPRDAVYAATLGQAFIGEDAAAEAEANLRAAVALAPRMGGRVHQSLALLLGHDARLSPPRTPSQRARAFEAVSLFRAALVLLPIDHIAYVELGRLLISLEIDREIEREIDREIDGARGKGACAARPPAGPRLSRPPSSAATAGDAASSVSAADHWATDVAAGVAADEAPAGEAGGGAVDEVAGAWRAAQTVMPSNAQAQQLLSIRLSLGPPGRGARTKGCRKEARRHASRALALEPASSLSYLALGLADASTVSPKTDAARREHVIGTLRRAVAMEAGERAGAHPNSRWSDGFEAGALGAIGALLASRPRGGAGDAAESLAAFRRAKELAPTRELPPPGEAMVAEHGQSRPPGEAIAGHAAEHVAEGASLHAGGLPRDEL